MISDSCASPVKESGSMLKRPSSENMLWTIQECQRLESVSNTNEPAGEQGFPPHHYITCDYCGKEPKPDSGEEWVSFGGGTWFHNGCWRSKLRGRRTWKRACGWKWSAEIVDA